MENIMAGAPSPLQTVRSIKAGIKVVHTMARESFHMLTDPNTRENSRMANTMAGAHSPLQMVPYIPDNIMRTISTARGHLPMPTAQYIQENSKTASRTGMGF